MNPVLYALPLDWKGESPDNRTKGERHDLTDQYDLPFRIVVLRNGYFFTDNLYIIDGKGYVLKEDRDYQCVAFNSDAADKTSKTVCAVIVIINPNVSPIIEVDAQMLGGEYCSVVPSIVEAAKGLMNSTRKIHWNNITGKPDDYRPNGHMHALWELFGFTPQVMQLKRITAGFERSVQKDFDALLVKFDQNMSVVEKLLDAVEQQLTDHIADVVSKPHRETKAQIGLGLVQDYPVATAQEASAPNASIVNRYATPWSMAVSIRVNFLDKLDEHKANMNNPHNVTASQLNVYTIPQFNTIIQDYVPLHSTVRQSTRIYGQTPLEWYNVARYDNEVRNIDVSAGRVHPSRFSHATGWPGRQYYLTPGLDWYPIAAQFKKFEIISTKIIPMIGSRVSSDGGIVALATSALADPVLYPGGTIMIVNMPYSIDIGTSNGSIVTTSQNIGMCVRLKNADGSAGAWVRGTGPTS
ncbi:virion structural protein [Pseudomonas phage Psa21]|uniref:Virion structural protein n=1 Tax=Pseudomonas phage Psa21 TaxID=2530023 RepID=A0A481W5Q5_9CAUD|nr:virion structural protein [Pseudomonas phage Psa21]QBJ02713.1 virion structural protein [Pseudomonas phage Psa21]